MLISYYRHELHTSLNAIIGYSELLLEDAHSSGLNAVESGLLEILNACRSLLAFAKELLNPSRLQELDVATLALLTQQMYDEGQEPAQKVVNTCATLIGAAEQAGLYGIIPDLCKIQASGNMLQNLLDAHNSVLVASAAEVQQSAARDELNEADKAAGGGARILIIDDNSMNRDLLHQWLERRGYRVDEASGGRQGLDFIAEQSYDLVLLDLRMPDLSGLEVLGELKTQGRIGQLPVVMLSASDELNDVASCIEYGALDYLVKPVNLAILDIRIRSYLERQRQRLREQRLIQQLQQEQQGVAAARLLELPPAVAERIRQGRGAEVFRFADVTVLWAEFVGCARLYEEHSPEVFITHMGRVAALCETLTGQHGLIRLSSPLVACIAVAGLPVAQPEQAVIALTLATALRDEVARLNRQHGLELGLGIGVHSGPVLAGVLDASRPVYGVWGETCSIVRQLGAAAPAGEIYVSAELRQQLGAAFRGEELPLPAPHGDKPRFIYRLRH